MAQKPHSNGMHEVNGLILLGLGTLLFLALVSYHPADTPQWMPTNAISPQNDPIHNFIGPVGAIVANLSYFFFGAASYLIAVLLLGFGGAKLLTDRVRFIPRALWVVLFVLAGACLLHLQGFALASWKNEMQIQGPGGWVGSFFGEKILHRVLGPVGAVILVSVAYLASMILLANIHPVLIIRSLRKWLSEWGVRREVRLRERADLEKQLEMDRKRIEREQKRLEKELRRKNVDLPPLADSTLPAETFPEPRIFDASAVVPSKAKPRTPPEESALNPAEPAHYENYQLPDVELLNMPDMLNRQAADEDELRAIQATIIETLSQFNISVSPGDITRGPTITRYEVYPAKGVRVDKITSLERDIARATRAERINILAPIPGKDTVGIEIANSRKVTVTLREIIESDDWTSCKHRIPIVLGKDVYGKTILADLAQMPHCLVAGTTGSGKSVCINAVVASILYRFTPEHLRFIMIDPKVVEMQIYNTLPHLVVPVVTDSKKVLLALRWVINEMEKRYKIFAKSGVRNIVSFNALAAKNAEERRSAPLPPEPPPVLESLEDEELPPDDELPPPPIRVPRDEDLIIPDHLPYIVVIIDELADLMQTAPADVESAIARITQMARAAGIHMIVATQTPRADVITGVIKANIPSRIAFQVASKLDSRVILDENGAERLLGQGDMLYLPPGTSRLVRSQGVLVTDDEIHKLVGFVSAQNPPNFDADIHGQLNSEGPVEEEVSEEDEELVTKCMEVIRQEKRASTSMLQRRLKLGYTRAARIVDILELRGILGPGEGAKPREILVDLDDPDSDHLG